MMNEISRNDVQYLHFAAFLKKKNRSVNIKTAFTRDRIRLEPDISLVFTRDLVDPVRIGSAIRYQIGLLMKVILCGTLPFQFRSGPV